MWPEVGEILGHYIRTTAGPTVPPASLAGKAAGGDSVV